MLQASYDDIQVSQITIIGEENLVRRPRDAEAYGSNKLYSAKAIIIVKTNTIIPCTEHTTIHNFWVEQLIAEDCCEMIHLPSKIHVGFQQNYRQQPLTVVRNAEYQRRQCSSAVGQDRHGQCRQATYSVYYTTSEDLYIIQNFQAICIHLLFKFLNINGHIGVVACLVHHFILHIGVEQDLALQCCDCTVCKHANYQDRGLCKEAHTQTLDWHLKARKYIISLSYGGSACLLVVSFPRAVSSVTRYCAKKYQIYKEAY
uniref:Transmembrane domain-containing protein n=1 Tax=Spironucleus salmonicida TaxID=348837 RepID=V6LKA0_9EUKA|eukprot:EST44758.1 Transmembrane domain-containing protein [Spironucleus salmonicida]